ncbi:hypothetical protein K8I85_18535, partial [bacterium]|nr:hypothetical protein [bacterium]
MQIPRAIPRCASGRWKPRFPSFVPALLLALGPLAAAPGHADLAGKPSRIHALTGATLVTSPGAEPFRGTVILRDGRIEMVGVDVEVPPGAVRHDLPGRTIYAGWVEPYL